MKWFSPPTSDDSADEADKTLRAKKENASKAKSSDGKAKICENIYSKTYKKRQRSYERKSDKIGFTDSSASQVKSSLYLLTQPKTIPSIAGVKSQRGRPRKPFKPLAIAKQLIEKARGEKRFQLQKVSLSDTSPVSRFGRTVKKKVLDYDDLTGRKRNLEGAEMPPFKSFKGSEGERKFIRAGIIYKPKVYI